MRNRLVKNFGVAVMCLSLVALSSPAAAVSEKDCPGYKSALIDARDALSDGDRDAAISHLRRAKSALRACTIRSEADVTVSG